MKDENNSSEINQNVLPTAFVLWVNVLNNLKVLLAKFIKSKNVVMTKKIFTRFMNYRKRTSIFRRQSLELHMLMS